jgi:membrane-associated protease RseP (regulator of RpoE activity)
VGLLGIVLFVFALLFSIVLHEAGHMVCARKAGGKVTEFFVGFGPKIWSFRRGETEYGVKALPAGGYVKIIGMTDLEPIDPEDEPRAFYRKPLGPRLITLAAGSIVHFLIALILLAMVPMIWGDVKRDTSGVVGHVNACLRTTAGDCQPGDPKSPAAAAGIQPGDKIVAVDGKPVSSWDDVTTQLHAGQPAATSTTPANQVTVTVVRDGRQLPPMSIIPERGNASTEKGKYSAGLLIGISAPDAYTKNVNPIQAVGEGFTQFGSIAKSSVQGLVDIPASIPKLFKQTTSNQPRSADTPVGVVGMAGLSGDVIKTGGYASFLTFVASINLFIGIFNLLPLLPLDGGHIAIALYEAARRKIAAFRSRPDPGRVDLNKLMPVAFTFLVLFVGLSLLLMAADITNPLKFPS